MHVFRINLMTSLRCYHCVSMLNNVIFLKWYGFNSHGFQFHRQSCSWHPKLTCIVPVVPMWLSGWCQVIWHHWIWHVLCYLYCGICSHHFSDFGESRTSCKLNRMKRQSFSVQTSKCLLCCRSLCLVGYSFPSSYYLSV